MAALGSVTQTIARTANKNTVWIVTLSWTGSVDNGSVPSTLFSTAIMNKIMGTYLFSMETVPDGTNKPTALYDISILDEDSFDVLGGVGADRSQTAKEKVIPRQDSGQALYGPVLIHDALTFALANNSEASAKGIARMFFAIVA